MASEPANWSVEEAREYLPRAKLLLEVVARAAKVAAVARGNGHGDLEGTDGAEVTVQEALGELDARGIVVRDIGRGLIDFPSQSANGRLVLLCWQFGEDDLGWWHLPEDGFAGRRPLPVPPDV